MDTRQKILTLEQSQTLPSPLTIVTGHFDPLQVSQATRLASMMKAANLLVLLTDPPQPLLPLAARAQLLAALSSVRAVVPLTDLTPDAALAHFPHATVLRQEALHLQERAALLAHITARHTTQAAVTT